MVTKENVKLQKQMEAFMITLEGDYSPTSHYYQCGKLGILESSSLKAFDLSFQSDRKWGMVLGSVGWEG
jgi:hypothetical protein